MSVVNKLHYMGYTVKTLLIANTTYTYTYKYASIIYLYTNTLIYMSVFHTPIIVYEIVSYEMVSSVSNLKVEISACTDQILTLPTVSAL